MQTQPMAAATDLRVMVVEDHELVREAIERRLNAADGFAVAGLAESAAAADSMFRDQRPDIVLVDHSLPDGSGMDVLRAVRSHDPNAIVVMLSAYDDAALISQYLTGGANGYAHKTVSASELVRVMRAAAAGQPALDPVATQRVLQRLADPPVAETTGVLSRRETQVLSLVASGHTNDDIAAELYISPQTVKTHLSRIFGKLGVRDRASATAKAIREGLVD